MLYLDPPTLSEHLTHTLVPAARREQSLATLGERLLFGWTSTRLSIQGNQKTLKEIGHKYGPVPGSLFEVNKRLWRQLVTNRPKPSESWSQYSGLGKGSAPVVTLRSESNFAKILAAKISPGSSTIFIRSCRWGLPGFWEIFKIAIV